MSSVFELLRRISAPTLAPTPRRKYAASARPPWHHQTTLQSLQSSKRKLMCVFDGFTPTGLKSMFIESSGQGDDLL